MEPIVITETMQIGVACAAIGGMVGYIFGWLRGMDQAENDRKQQQDTPG